MKKLMHAIIALVALSSAAHALGARETPTTLSAPLSVDARFSLVASDPSAYLKVKGPALSIDSKLDAASGASTGEATTAFNIYRMDSFGKKTMPYGLRSFLLFGIAPDSIRLADLPAVIKRSDGSMLVRYVHRGTAYEFSTDTAGAIQLPLIGKMRKIGHTNNQISTDFSASGKVADVDWSKVWDASIAADKLVEGTPGKTGPIAVDAADSQMIALGGSLALSLQGDIVSVKGDLSINSK